MDLLNDDIYENIDVNLNLDYDLSVEEKSFSGEKYIELPLLGFRLISELKKEGIKYLHIDSDTIVIDKKDTLHRINNQVVSVQINTDEFFRVYLDKLIDVIDLQLLEYQKKDKDFDITDIMYQSSESMEKLFCILLCQYTQKYKNKDAMSNESIFKMLCILSIRYGIDFENPKFNIRYMFDNEKSLISVWKDFIYQLKVIKSTDNGLKWYNDWLYMQYNTRMDGVMAATNDFNYATILYLKTFNKDLYNRITEITSVIDLRRLHMLKNYFGCYCRGKYKTLYNKPPFYANYWVQKTNIILSDMQSYNNYLDKLNDILKDSYKFIDEIFTTDIFKQCNTLEFLIGKVVRIRTGDDSLWSLERI